MRLSLFSASVLAVLLSGPAAAACSSHRVVDLHRDAVVKVETDDGAQVSGVVVAQDRVVTVWHGLAGANAAAAVFGAERRSAAVLHTDAEADLALLAVPTGAVKPLTLLNRALDLNEAVWVYGWPAGRYQTVGEGVFVGEWQGALRVSSMVAAGQSGGALIACQSDREMLAGLVTGFGATDMGGDLLRIPKMSLAVPALELLRFFERSGGVRLHREQPSG